MLFLGRIDNQWDAKTVFAAPADGTLRYETEKASPEKAGLLCRLL